MATVARGGKVARVSRVAKVARVGSVARLAMDVKGDDGGKGGNVTKTDLSGKICNGYQHGEESECG